MVQQLQLHPHVKYRKTPTWVHVLTNKPQVQHFKTGLGEFSRESGGSMLGAGDVEDRVITSERTDRTSNAA